MKASLSCTVLLVWAVVTLDLTEGNPLPDHTSGRGFPFQPNRLVPSSSASSAKDKDYSDAIYAARLAFELERLQKQQGDVYADFISAGFEGQEIPRRLPVNLQMLSRTDPPTTPAFSISPSRFVGFRFPEQSDDIFFDQPRSVLDSRPSDFPVRERRPFLSSRRLRRPVLANSFGSASLTPEPGNLFTFNHRFAPF